MYIIAHGKVWFLYKDSFFFFPFFACLLSSFLCMLLFCCCSRMGGGEWEGWQLERNKGWVENTRNEYVGQIIENQYYLKRPYRKFSIFKLIPNKSLIFFIFFCCISFFYIKTPKLIPPFKQTCISRSLVMCDGSSKAIHNITHTKLLGIIFHKKFPLNFFVIIFLLFWFLFFFFLITFLMDEKMLKPW